MIYAIGDIHGRADALVVVLDKIEADAAEQRIERPRVVFLGDYIDRGTQSRRVLEMLSSPELRRRFDPIFLMGNHEDALLTTLIAPKNPFHWLAVWGGAETVESYGVKTGHRSIVQIVVDFREIFPEHHLAFLRDLKLSHQEGGYFFAHAGIDPDRPLDDQDADDLMYIRDRFLKDDRDHGAIVVHGHTPDVMVIQRPNRIGIDTASGHDGGYLSAVALGRGKVRVIDEL